MTDYNRTPEAQDVFKEKRKPKGPIKFKLSLNEEQKEAKDTILNTPVTLIEGKAGSGKANWVNSKILTPDGYKLMGDIQPGDLVLSEDGKPIEVLQTFPQGIQKIYRVEFSDGSETYCTDDHLWNVIKRNDLHVSITRNGKPNPRYQVYQTLSLRQIIDNGLVTSNKNKFFIPVSSPVEYTPKDLKLDPYIMGCLLGDGCLIGTPSITTTDDFILNSFREYFQTWEMNVTESSPGSITHHISSGKGKQVEFNGCIYNTVEDLIKYLKISNGTYYKRVNNGTYIVSEIKNKLTSFLIDHDLYNKNSFNKHIPQDYLYSTIDDRISILQGLLDTDGWVDINKFRTNKGLSSSVKFCTTSEQLLKDVIHIVNSLGGVCYTSTRMGKWRKKGETEYITTSINYQLHISFKNPDIENRLFRLERKQSRVTLTKNIINRSISKIEYAFDDYAQCILVDSPTHLYLVDNYVVTHNTTLACQIALDLLFRKDIEQIIIARPFVTAGENIGYLPGGVDQKLEYLTFPIYDLMTTMTGDPAKIEKIQSENKIKVMPVGFLRGHTFSDSMIIIDEAQNLTKKQTELILGRLGETSKLVFCGDKPQCDLPNKLDSGINLLYDLSKNIPSFGYVKLLQNHRHPIVDEILNYIKENGL